MTRIMTIRLGAELADKIDGLAAAVGRPRSHVARFVLSKAEAEDLPKAWFEGADAQRLASGRAIASDAAPEEHEEGWDPLR